MKIILSAILVALALAGCEKTQTAPSARKPDTKPWVATGSPFVAPGWKPGDEASWESQMRNRAAKQNEYVSSRPRE